MESSKAEYSDCFQVHYGNAAHLVKTISSPTQSVWSHIIFSVTSQKVETNIIMSASPSGEYREGLFIRVQRHLQPSSFLSCFYQHLIIMSFLIKLQVHLSFKSY